MGSRPRLQGTGSPRPSPERAMTMGRWFPGFRTGTPEQCAAYRVCELEKPLSRTQRWWHFQRVDAEQELIRLQRASDRQDRQQRRTGRSR